MKKLVKKSQGPFRVKRPGWRTDGWTVTGPTTVVANAEVAVEGPEIRRWYPDKGMADKACKASNWALARGEIKAVEVK